MPQKKILIAVVQFPGTNCELEAVRACQRNGMKAELFRWNDKRTFAKFDGVILAGGFSYEDRGRSGLIASRDSILEKIFILAKRGGVVLGICNGAQILVESGLVPNFELGKSTLALTHNRRVQNGKVVGTGFFNTWTHIKPCAKKPNAFNQFSDQVLRVPIAHAEGRFFSEDTNLWSKIIDHEQNAFVYCNKLGEILPEFPINPNGSVLNLAGVTNPMGNVMALMPHPERTIIGNPIFRSIRKWIEEKTRKPTLSFSTRRFGIKAQRETLSAKIGAKPKADVEFFVKLKITDNEALSVGKAANLKLVKFRWFKLNFVPSFFRNSNEKIIKILEKIILSGELLNTEKETVFVKFKGKFWRTSQSAKLISAKFFLPKNRILACERETSSDESHTTNLNHILASSKISCLKSGTVWSSSDKKSSTKFNQAIHNNFFHHPASMQLINI